MRRPSSARSSRYGPRVKPCSVNVAPDSAPVSSAGSTVRRWAAAPAVLRALTGTAADTSPDGPQARTVTVRCSGTTNLEARSIAGPASALSSGTSYAVCTAVPYSTSAAMPTIGSHGTPVTGAARFANSRAVSHTRSCEAHRSVVIPASACGTSSYPSPAGGTQELNPFPGMAVPMLFCRSPADRDGFATSMTPAYSCGSGNSGSTSLITIAPCEYPMSAHFWSGHVRRAVLSRSRSTCAPVSIDRK